VRRKTTTKCNSQPAQAKDFQSAVASHMTLPIASHMILPINFGIAITASASAVNDKHAVNTSVDKTSGMLGQASEGIPLFLLIALQDTLVHRQVCVSSIKHNCISISFHGGFETTVETLCFTDWLWGETYTSILIMRTSNGHHAHQSACGQCPQEP